MYSFYDYSLMLLVPAFLLTLWAQFNVKSTFDRYSKISTRKGVTAAEVASMLLNREKLLYVPVNRVAGLLTDHYDPVKRTVNLSDSVYGSTSIASLGVAAHECGHAIQHSTGNSALMFRNSIVPAINLGSTLAIPLFFIGLAIKGEVLMMIGILLFTGVVIFHLLTLPIEFDASSRALTMLQNTGTLTQGELVCARAVLRAAAWTYIATAVTAVIHLLRLVMLKNQRR